MVAGKGKDVVEEKDPGRGVSVQNDDSDWHLRVWQCKK